AARKGLQGRAEHGVGAGGALGAGTGRGPGDRETAPIPIFQNEQMSNGSSITEFLLLAFADTRELQLVHFWLFLGIYLAALLGNGLIITTVVCDHHLHTPMYFFLLNLSVLDLGSTSTTVPKSVANSLWDTRAISFQGCASQVFFFFFSMLQAQSCSVETDDHMIFRSYKLSCSANHS
uniref:G-protein coupled receptors family 1 profile domain-containing protein n=1 Tax=Calidris pygmaea TaxID=425635 RepID=A0A8C3KKH8_9CHAR